MTTLKISIREVVTSKELKEFIHLPAKLHQNHHNWVPPIYQDEWHYLNPEKNKAFGYCETTLVLAYQDKEPVGRIMGIINRRHNEGLNLKEARFGLLESTQDIEVAGALLEYVENWAKTKGMTRIIGPFGMTGQDPQGFIIEGFGEEPNISTYYNFEYLPGFLRELGYDKDADSVVYKISILDKIPEFYQKIFSRASQRNEFQLVEFKKRKEIKPYIRPALELMNQTYNEIYGYTLLDELEIDELGRKYLPILDTRFIKLVKRNNEVVAFIVGLPNINKGLRKAKGYLFPLGIFFILRDLKKSKQLDLLLGGIHPNYQGMGLDVLMGLKMVESAQKAGFRIIDSHLELELNYKMRAEMEKMGGVIYKRYRIYFKELGE